MRWLRPIKPLSPVQTHYLAMEDMADTLRSFRQSAKGLTPKLAVGGICLTMYQGRTNCAGGIQDENPSRLRQRIYRISSPIDFQSVLQNIPLSGQYLCITSRTTLLQRLTPPSHKRCYPMARKKCRTHSGNGNEVKRRRRWQMARWRRGLCFFQS